MKNLFILDNNGDTLDRYTIINEKDGEMIGSSDMPFNPLGFGQYCGNVCDNYWVIADGHNWRFGCHKRLLNKRIKFAIDYFKNGCSNIGKPISWEQLPEDVKKFALKSFQ